MLILFSTFAVVHGIRSNVKIDGPDAKDRCSCTVGLPPLAEASHATLLLAQHECDAITDPLPGDGMKYYAYVHAPTSCAPQWCCKELSQVDHLHARQAATQFQVDLSIYTKTTASDLVHQTEVVLARAQPLFEEDQVFLEKSTQVSLSLVQLELVSVIQNVLDAILLCSSSSLDSVVLPCGAPRVFAIHMKQIADQIVELTKEYHSTLNLIFLGDKDPLSSARGLAMSAVHLARQKMAVAAKFLKSAALAAPSVAVTIISSVARALSQTVSFLWRKRMIICATGFVIMNAANIAEIIHSTLVSTSVSAGIMPVFEGIMSKITTKLLCPLATNSIVIGFLAHWIIDNIILSDAGQIIIEELISPFTFLYDGWTWIRNWFAAEKRHAFSKRLTGFLKELNQNYWAPIIYSYLYSHVAGIFHLANTLICVTADATDTTAKVVLNGAEQVVHKAVASGSDWFTWGVLSVKEYLGGSVYLAERVGDRQKIMDLGAGMPFAHEYFEQLHLGILNIMRVAGVGGQTALWSGRKFNEVVEYGLQLDFATSFGHCFDHLDGLSHNAFGSPFLYVLAVGGASMIAANSLFYHLIPDAALREITPESLKSFLAFEEDQVATAVHEARELKPKITDFTKADLSVALGTDTFVWDAPAEKISVVHYAMSAFQHRFQGNETLTRGKKRPRDA